jgi:hypothetical protein
MSLDGRIDIDYNLDIFATRYGLDRPGIEYG